ncbi:MAG: GntR family transcriptional regulator [Gammaproteobacteria bacterium]|nr:GntR family transcriptional regulator [Gammaproteobacteria bacterium]
MNRINSTKDQRFDLSRSSVARYIQLATLFRRQIETGAWQPGQQIPTVDELAVEFGVARATIRQAIGLLEKDGLVSRFRAKGTFVNELPDKPVWCEVETDWNGLLTSRDNATIEILSDFSSVVLPRMEHAPGQFASAYRHLRRKHFRGGIPYLLADLYIDAKLAAGLDKQTLSTTTAMRLAASLPKVKISNALQTLTIGSADLETARELDIALNAPVCYVDRFAVDQRGRLILVSKGIYRGDIFRMDIKLR